MGLLITGLFAIGAFGLGMTLLYIVFADSASAGEDPVLPEKELRFGEGFVDLLDVGAKTITIRAGRREFEPGELVIAVCAEGDRFLIEIESCSYHQLGTVPMQDYREDGFTDIGDMLTGLGRFYSDITVRSIVSVIRFEVREWLGD